MAADWERNGSQGCLPLPIMEKISLYYRDGKSDDWLDFFNSNS
jgi:hypothetical protein